MNREGMSGTMKTLFIPLYGKAMESNKNQPILRDEKAAWILSQIEHDFGRVGIPRKTNVMMCLRAKMMDEIAEAFIALNPHSLVLHLGCGLDSRYDRIGKPSSVNWIDVDYPEVIELRKAFFEETDHYRMIGSSVTDPGWIKAESLYGQGALVIAEGLFMYLDEAHIKELLYSLKQKLQSYDLLFDAFSQYTAKRVQRHPSLRSSGVTHFWGIDDPQSMENWFDGIEFKKELAFTDHPAIQTQNRLTRFLFGFAGKFAFVRKAHRVLLFQIR